MKKEGTRGISKRELMNRIGAGSQSIHNWRTLYIEGRLNKLLSHNKKGFKPSVFTEKEHHQLSVLLHNPKNDIIDIAELREWVKTEFKKT